MPPENTLQFQLLLANQEEETGSIPLEIYENVSKAVWVDVTPQQAISATPIKILLKKDVTCLKKKQYLRREAQMGIQPLLDKFLKHEFFHPCQSPCNTCILPVKTSHSNECQFVQDLRYYCSSYSPPQYLTSTLTDISAR